MPTIETTTRYKCDVCQTEWDTHKAAQSCERVHVTHKGAKVIRALYNKRGSIVPWSRGTPSTPDNLPDAVVIQFPNGKQLVYRYVQPKGV